MPWLTPVLAVLFVLVSLLMMLVILIQKPKGGGLSGAFGGAGGGSTQAAFGAKVGDVLTWATVIFFVLFLGLAMGLQWNVRWVHRPELAAPGPPGQTDPPPGTTAGMLDDALEDEPDPIEMEDLRNDAPVKIETDFVPTPDVE